MTCRPFVPLPILQRAHWERDTFKSLIPLTSSAFSPTSPTAVRDTHLAAGDSIVTSPEERTDLGLAVPAGTSERAFSVAVDNTTRINDCFSAAAAAASSSSTTLPSKERSKNTGGLGAESFFGIGKEERSTDAQAEEVRYEPCRFSVGQSGFDSPQRMVPFCLLTTVVANRVLGRGQLARQATDVQPNHLLWSVSYLPAG
jgi:hypothetical protein